jgi:hypothetical protein
MSNIGRREFFTSTAIAVGATTLSAAPQKRTAVDWVPLGNSGAQVTRLAFGTGTPTIAVFVFSKRPTPIRACRKCWLLP